MTIKTIKDLNNVVKLCKRHGITGIKVGNVEFNLEPIKQPRVEPIAPEANVKVPKFNGNLQPDKIDTDALTEEQLMYYSVKEDIAND